MISRLSGQPGQPSAAPELAHDMTTLPTRREAERVIRQFFALIEHFQTPDPSFAPEVKARLAGRAAAKPKQKRRAGA